MIETYAFLAMFAIQILVGSVLTPAWLIRRVRAKVASSAERFAELFPGVDHNLSAERFATRHRALNTGMAVLGLLLLGWLFIHMRRPEWNQGKVPVLLLTAYLLAQMSPLILIGAKAAKVNKAFKSSLADGKRKAVLQRRQLFDFSYGAGTQRDLRPRFRQRCRRRRADAAPGAGNECVAAVEPQRRRGRKRLHGYSAAVAYGIFRPP